MVSGCRRTAQVKILIHSSASVIKTPPGKRGCKCNYDADDYSIPLGSFISRRYPPRASRVPMSVVQPALAVRLHTDTASMNEQAAMTLPPAISTAVYESPLAVESVEPFESGARA